MEQQLRTVLAVTNALAGFGDDAKPALARALQTPDGDRPSDDVLDALVRGAPFDDENEIVELIGPDALERFLGTAATNGGLPGGDRAVAAGSPGVAPSNGGTFAVGDGTGPFDTDPPREIDDYLVDGTPIGEAGDREPATSCARLSALEVTPRRVEHRAQLGRVEPLTPKLGPPLVRISTAVQELREEFIAAAATLPDDLGKAFTDAATEYLKNPGGGINGAVKKGFDSLLLGKNKMDLIVRVNQQIATIIAAVAELEAVTRPVATAPTKPDLLDTGKVTLELANFTDADRGRPALVRIGERIVYRLNAPPADKASVATVTLGQAFPMRRVRYRAVPRHRDRFDPDSTTYGRNERRVPVNSARIEGSYRLHGNYGLVDIEVIYVCRRSPDDGFSMESAVDNLSVKHAQLEVSGETESQVEARAERIDETTRAEIDLIRGFVDEVKLSQGALGKLVSTIPGAGAVAKAVIDGTLDGLELWYGSFEREWKQKTRDVHLENLKVANLFPEDGPALFAEKD